MRLDNYLVQAGYFGTIKEAQSFIMQGRVIINDALVTKAGFILRLPPEPAVRIKGAPANITRSAGKLAGFIEAFAINVKDRTVFDIGCAHGGFTQIVLEHGASRVVMVDVARGQVAWPLREDARTLVLERTHARSLHPGSFFTNLRYPDFFWSERSSDQPTYAQWATPCPMLFVCDVSFISIKELLPALFEFTRACPPEGLELIVLFKPQFEVPSQELTDGIVTSPQAVGRALADLITFLQNMASYSPPKREAATHWPGRPPLVIHWSHLAPAQVTGRHGNREYVMRLVVQMGDQFSFELSDQAGQIIEGLKGGQWAD